MSIPVSLGTGVALYGASAGNPLFAVEDLVVGGALKAFTSAIDNFLFKKSQAAKVALVLTSNLGPCDMGFLLSLMRCGDLPVRVNEESFKLEDTDAD